MGKPDVLKGIPPALIELDVDDEDDEDDVPTGSLFEAAVDLLDMSLLVLVA